MSSAFNVSFLVNLQNYAVFITIQFCNYRCNPILECLQSFLIVNLLYFLLAITFTVISKKPSPKNFTSNQGQVAPMVENPPPIAGDLGNMGLIPELERSLEEGMAMHSSILAWRIPWAEEPGGLPFIGLQRVRHNGWLNTYAIFSSKGFLSYHYI